MGKLSVLCLVVAVFASVLLVVNGYQISRDIDGWKTRAQVSSEPNDMHEYMSKVKSGMEDYRMTSGYAVLIFKTPENDMALIYHTVNQHVDQAQVLTTVNRSSPEYQTGLDNLRGSIRELNLYAFAFWSVHEGLAWLILFILGWICVCLFGCIWLENF